MVKMKFTAVFLAFSFIATIGHSQKVNNVKAELDGDNVKITFDLEAQNSSDLFEVKLFASHNNFSEPLKLISGTAGKSIKPGRFQVITWKAKEELVNFKGEITFEVRATLMGAYYTVTNPTSSGKFKKGKLMPINWQGGNSGEKVKIELVKLNQPVATISEGVGNQGSYIWTIPKNIKPSKAYQVRISSTSDVDSKGLSKAFTVKGKSAAPYIIITLALGGGAAYYFLKPTEPGPVVTETTALPRPPNP
jgi:hypothetical protein